MIPLTNFQKCRMQVQNPIFIFFIVDMGGGGQIFVKSFDGLVCVYKNHSDWIPSTGMNCLNANFISYASQLPGGGAFFIYSEFDFFCDDLHLQIIASISPKSICREFISPVGYFFHKI